MAFTRGDQGKVPRLREQRASRGTRTTSNSFLDFFRSAAFSVSFCVQPSGSVAFAPCRGPLRCSHVLPMPVVLECVSTVRTAGKMALPDSSPGFLLLGQIETMSEHGRSLQRNCKDGDATSLTPHIRKRPSSWPPEGPARYVAKAFAPGPSSSGTGRSPLHGVGIS